MNQQQKISRSASQYEPWFDSFVAEIRSHELQLETETAPAHMKDFYQSFISGDDDTENEERLFKAEAVVNAKYYQYGFHLSLTIVEKSDEISVPPHFVTIFPSGKLPGAHTTSKA